MAAITSSTVIRGMIRPPPGFRPLRALHLVRFLAAVAQSPQRLAGLFPVVEMEDFLPDDLVILVSLPGDDDPVSGGRPGQGAADGEALLLATGATRPVAGRFCARRPPGRLRDWPARR